MRRLEYKYTVDLHFSECVRDHLFQLRCLCQDNLYQHIEEQDLEIEPVSLLGETTDSFGNKVVSGKISEDHDHFHYELTGVACVDYQRLKEEDCHPLYSFETALTKYDASMEILCPTGSHFFENMMELSRNIYFEIYYTPGSTNVSTTAKESFAMKKGVCQDFAHIFLAVVRHLGYPARYVAGMMAGEGETHAWVEVYHNGMWHGFDPTNNRPVNNQYIVIAKGRDYQDCVIDRGTFEAKNFVKQEIKAHVSVKVL